MRRFLGRPFNPDHGEDEVSWADLPERSAAALLASLSTYSDYPRKVVFVSEVFSMEMACCLEG